MIRTRWTGGPAGDDGTLFVSVTDFRVFRVRDLPRVWLEGLRLRRAWPRMPGAVGLWLWAKPLARRGGSVSIWRGEEDLRAFVRWPVHVEVVRRNRARGELASTTWHSDEPARGEVWGHARAWIEGR